MICPAISKSEHPLSPWSPTPCTPAKAQNHLFTQKNKTKQKPPRQHAGAPCPITGLESSQPRLVSKPAVPAATQRAHPGRRAPLPSRSSKTSGHIWALPPAPPGPGARARQAALPRAVPTHLRPRSCPRPRPRPRCRRRRPPPRAAPRSALTSRRPARRRRSRLGTARTAPRCSPRVASQWESSASRASRRPADRRWGKVCG